MTFFSFQGWNIYRTFLISNFCHVINVVCFLLGNSLVSEFRRQGITQKEAYNILGHSVKIKFRN